MNERTSPHKQRAILTRETPLPTTRRDVHYAQTNPTNWTPKDIYAQRTSNQSGIVAPAPVSVERKGTSLSNFEGAAFISRQRGPPWAHTVAVRTKRPLAKHAKPFGGANASSRAIQSLTFQTCSVTSQQGGIPWAHTTAVRIERPVRQACKAFRGCQCIIKDNSISNIRGRAQGVGRGPN